MQARILVVEDETSVATGVARMLSAEGYDVEVAGDGRRALDLALAGAYDLIVLDIMIPHVNGYEVCRTLRRHGITSAIVMLTAKTGEWDIAEGLDLGADDYLTKPFSSVVLLARVRARLRSRAGQDASPLSNGDLQLHPALRRCVRDGVEIELTQREARLLSVLFENLNRPVSKEQLLADAWGAESQADANAVEVYVGRLRRKLDMPFGTDDIETVRGAGYRLRTHDPLRKASR